MSNESSRVTIAIVGAVAAAAAMCVYQWVRSDIQSGRWDATYRQLSAFHNSLWAYAAVHGHLPGPTLREAVAQCMEEEATSDGFAAVCGMLIADRDAWGRPFVYELHTDGAAVAVRSLGPNGKDDLGAGDDLQVVLKLPRPATRKA